MSFGVMGLIAIVVGIAAIIWQKPLAQIYSRGFGRTPRPHQGNGGTLPAQKSYRIGGIMFIVAGAASVVFSIFSPE